MGRGWSSFEAHDKIIAAQVILVKSQEERRAEEKASIFLENINNHEQNVGKIWALESLLVTSQQKQGLCCWKLDKKVILITKREGPWLNCVPVLAFCGREHLERGKETDRPCLLPPERKHSSADTLILAW